MPLQITAPPDARLLTAAVRRGLRPLVLTSRGLGWAAIVLAVAVQAATGEISFALLLTGVLLAVAFPMFLTNIGIREAMQDAAPTTYEITETGIATASRHARHAYSWNAFRFVEESSGQLIFGRSRTRVLPVPTAGLTPAQIRQVLGTAAGHGVRVRRA